MGQLHGCINATNVVTYFVIVVVEAMAPIAIFVIVPIEHTLAKSVE